MLCCNFEELSFSLIKKKNKKLCNQRAIFFTYNCTCGFINSFKVPVLELSWSWGLKPAKNTKKGLGNFRIQWFYCIKTPWAFLNFIFHSERPSTDGAQAKLRSCLDLWWEKHSFEYCLKLRRWVHISVETITEFYMNLNFLERIWTCPKSQLWQYEASSLRDVNPCFRLCQVDFTSSKGW